MAVSKRKGIDPITEHHYENLKFGKNKGNKTVFTLQVEHPKLNKGKPTLIPSIWDGKELSEDAAIKKAIDSKIKWTSADDHKELRKYDMLLHDPKKMNMDLDNTGDQKSFAEGGYNMNDEQINSKKGKNYPHLTGSLEGYGSMTKVPIITPFGNFNLNQNKANIAAMLDLIVPFEDGYVFKSGIDAEGSFYSNKFMDNESKDIDGRITKYRLELLKKIAGGEIGLRGEFNPVTNDYEVKAGYTSRFNTGGTTVQNQMSMFEDGGMMDQGGTQDPVSGNAVPVGSLQEEVRDDVDAKLSPGEYVVPADVVRYFGLDFFMQLRDKAKAGLARMEDIGQMGNSESTTDPTDTLFSQNEDTDVPFSKDDLEIYKEDNDEDEKLSAQVGAYVPTKQAPQTNTLDSYLARVGDKPAMYDGGLVDTSLRNRGISFPTGSVKRFVDTTDAKRSDLFITVDVNGNPTTQVPSGYAPADSFPSSSSDDPFKEDMSTLGATELDRPSGPDDNTIQAFNYAPPNEGGDLTQEQWDTYFAGKSAGERAKTAFDMMVKGIPGQGGGFSQLADMFGPVIPPMGIAEGVIQGISGRGMLGKLVDLFRGKEESYRVDPETGEKYADLRIESPVYSKETPTYAPDIPSPTEQRGDMQDYRYIPDAYKPDVDATNIPDIPTIDFDYTSDATDFDYPAGESLGNQDYKTGGFIKRKYAPGGLVDRSLANRRTSLIDKSLSEKGINTASNPKDTSVESEPSAEQSLLDPSTTLYKNTDRTYAQVYAPKLIARSSVTKQLKDPSLTYILGKYADPEDFENILNSYSTNTSKNRYLQTYRGQPGSDELNKELDDLFGQRLSATKPVNLKTNPDYFSTLGGPLPGFTAEEFKQKYGPDITIGDAYKKMLGKEYSVLKEMQSKGGELPNQFEPLAPFLNTVMNKGEESDNVIKTLTQKYINRTIDPNKKIETAQDATDVAKLVYFISSGGNAFPAPGEGEPFSVWSKMPKWNKALTAYKNANLIPQPLLKTANVGAFVTKPSKKKTSVKKRGLASKK